MLTILPDLSNTDDLHALGPYRDFREAARAVLELLQSRVEMDLWLMTRTEGDDWIVLAAADRDHEYGVKAGDVLNWSESFCYRMVRGEGPQVAARSDRVPAYAAAPIGRKIPIGAYVGVPVARSDGSLFGTLCAVHPQEQDESLQEALPLVRRCSRLLATILHLQMELEEKERRAEHAEAQSERDPLTGLYNLRGWRRLRDAEEHRCRRYQSPAGIVMIDLDELKEVNDREGHAAGNALLRRTANLLADTVRGSDVVARLGGDEFAILAVEQGPASLEQLTLRLEEALDGASIRASLGAASRLPNGDLETSQERADRAMYDDKRARAAASPASSQHPAG